MILFKYLFVFFFLLLLFPFSYSLAGLNMNSNCVMRRVARISVACGYGFRQMQSLPLLFFKNTATSLKCIEMFCSL